MRAFIQTSDTLTYSDIIKCESDLKKVERRKERLEDKGYTVFTYVLGVDRIGTQAIKK